MLHGYGSLRLSGLLRWDGDAVSEGVIPTFEILPPMKTPLQYTDHPIAIRAPAARCTPWPRRWHCRRRFHKAFLHWYTTNEDKFAIKLELLKRTDWSLDIGFCQIGRVVTAELGIDEINILIVWNGTFWDMLQCFEAIPKRVPGGYVCNLCPEHDRSIYPSREAIWRIEIFEPFLAWVNDDLANAEAVAVSGDPDRTTWARLVEGANGRLPQVGDHMA